jgi:OOP family OmpA-OmpF porin
LRKSHYIEAETPESTVPEIYACNRETVKKKGGLSMKIPASSFPFNPLLAALLLTLLAGPGLAGAPIAEGDARIAYWTTDDGVIVMTGTGECLHTQWWTPALAVAGCDPVAKPPPAAETETIETPTDEPAAPPTLTERVYFEFDKYLLDETDRQAIDALISRLEPAHTGRIRLEGHADRIGTEDYNLSLSQRRAASVGGYLTRKHGIAPERFDLEALGESQPQAFCGDDLGWAELLRCLQPNRRVRIELLRE